MKPGQKLTEFSVYRLYDPHPSKELVELSRDEAIAFEKAMKEPTSQGINAIARMSDRKGLLYQSPYCTPIGDQPDADHVTCWVECDGGSFNVRKTADGFNIAFDGYSQSMRFSDSCGGPVEIGEKGRSLTAEDAGQSFAMRPAPLETCRAADAELDAHLSKGVPSIREQVATKGWRCLKRVYDKAHLAKHPQQMVTAMAVAIKGPAITELSEGWPITRLETTMSMKLRNGKVVEQDVPCHASDYSYSCAGNVELVRRDESSVLLLAGQYDDLDEMHNVLDTDLGKDDVTFRLDASTDTTCTVD